jgi:Spy/CpxP family protein refolding chaperone
MKRINPSLFVLFSALILSAAVVARAQTQQTSQDRAFLQPPPSQNSNHQPGKPASLLQLLNLTPEQLQQIRAVNQETRENVRAANMKLRQARRALDGAIYADAPNQSQVEQLARALGDAQTVATKVRAEVEFRIRQILTSEQLVRFRDLRRQFEQKLRDRLLLQKKSLRQLNNKSL